MEVIFTVIRKQKQNCDKVRQYKTRLTTNSSKHTFLQLVIFVQQSLHVWNCRTGISFSSCKIHFKFFRISSIFVLLTIKRKKVFDLFILQETFSKLKLVFSELVFSCLETLILLHSRDNAFQSSHLQQPFEFSPNHPPPTTTH